MNEEEKKIMDNIALVAMQCILKKEVKLPLHKRLCSWLRGRVDMNMVSPTAVANAAYQYANAMMQAREQVIKDEPME